jgi:quinol monooxygenase YgiN
MIHVLARITTKPGKRSEVLASFAANVPAVRAEDGCIEYGATVDLEPVAKGAPCFGPDTFVVIEKWASPEALAAHAASAHMNAYREKTAALITERAVHILAPA